MITTSQPQYRYVNSPLQLSSDSPSSTTHQSLIDPENPWYIRPRLTTNNNLQTNQTTMLHDWLQAEFKNKLFLNVINSEERTPILHDFGLNIQEIPSHNFFPRYKQIEMKQWIQFLQPQSHSERMVGIDFISSLLKIKLPNKINQIVLDKKIRKFSITDTTDKTIRFIYAEKIKINNSNITDIKNYPIACIYKNILWLFWNIKDRSTTEIAIMKYVIDEAIKIMNGKFELKCTKDFKKVHFQNIMLQFTSGRKESIKKDLFRLVNNQKEYLKKYINGVNQEDIITKELMLLNNQEKYIKDKASNAIEYFKKTKKIKKWKSIGQNQIEFILDDLIMEHMEQKIILPKFKVHIDVTQGSFVVYPGSDSLQYINPIHPHVYQQGNVCMGNFSTIYPRLVSTGNFNQIADLIIQFLETYNEGSPIIQIWKYIAVLKLNKSWKDFSDPEKATAFSNWLTKVNKTKDKDEDYCQSILDDVID